jgi:uncharacterized protein YqgC (DUF456 family)
MITVAITTSPLYILAVALAGGAIFASFVPRLPAAALSFVALLCSIGELGLEASQVVFWGIAAAITTYLVLSQPKPDKAGIHAHIYVTAGALIGAMLGLLMNKPSLLIVASCIGALFAAMAFQRTPLGREYAGGKGLLAMLTAAGLPAIVNFKIITTILSYCVVLA